MSRWFIAVPGTAILSFFICLTALIAGDALRTSTTLNVGLTNMIYLTIVCSFTDAAEKEVCTGTGAAKSVNFSYLLKLMCKT